MAGKTFLDELAILNSQDFGGGLRDMGKALKEQGQNETLHSLWQQFQLKKDGLTTTGEQVNQFNKEYDSKTDSEGFFKGDSLSAPRGLKEDVQAGINLFGYLQKQEALLGTYQPFIQAFSVLGEDGVKIAKQLTDELASKLTLEESKGQIPFKQMEYDNMKMNFDWNKDKYESWLDDEKLRQDTFEASQFIMDSEVFDLIEGGDITTWRDSRLKKHNVAIQSVLDKAREHFGGKLSDSAILGGLKIAMDMTGKSFKFVEKQDFSNGGSGGGFNQMMIGSMKGNLQQWSSRWNNLDPQTQRDFSSYLKNPTDFKTQNPEYKTDAFDEMYEIYKPGGQYASFYTVLSGLEPNWNKLSVRPVDDNKKFPLATPKGEVYMDSPKMNMPGKDVEIIRMKDGSSFTTNDFLWNPKWVENYANQQEADWTKKLNDTNTFSNIYNNIGVNKLGNESPNNKVLNQFMHR